MPGTRKLGRSTDHRIATLRNLVTSLLENGRIVLSGTGAELLASEEIKKAYLGG